MPGDFVFRKAVLGGFNRDDVLNYIEKLKKVESDISNELKNTKNELAETQTALKNISDTLAETRKENDEIKLDFEKKLAELSESHKNEIESIKNEYEKKQNDVLADRSAREKIGTAMLEVRKYADMLAEETCLKISKISDDTDSAVEKTMARVLEITAGIRAFSDKLDSMITDIISENESICKELTDFKGSLKIPYEEAIGKITAEVFED